MTTNVKLINKADAVLSDLTAGGLLAPEEGNTFIRKLIDEPTLLAQSRKVVMSSPSRKINKIGFGSRILRPATENAGLAVGDRSKPDFGQIQLDTKEVIAEIRLPYAMIEDAIEGGNINANGGTPSDVTGRLKDTILALIAKRAALDLEELALLGDTGHLTDTYLQMVDGFLVQATTHVVDNASAGVSLGMLKSGLKTLPSPYLRDRAQMLNFLSIPNEIDIRDALAQRQTPLGDANQAQWTEAYAYGTKVVPVALMPDTDGMFTNPKNLIFGVQRDISLEFDKDISARQYIIVLTARVDFKIEELDAIVTYSNI